MTSPLVRVDLAADTAGLPPSLIAVIEKEGGLWAGGDAYTTAADVVHAAQELGVSALRLDFRNLDLLASLSSLRYLHIRTDGRPKLDPVAALSDLRALIIFAGALRGRVDPADFPALRWFRASLGGSGGAALATVLARGHLSVQWLSLRETTVRAAADLCAAFPRLRVLRVAYADRLRELGFLSAVTPYLEKVSLDLTQVRDLSGLADLQHLETLEVFGGRVQDLTPLASLPNLRYARLELPDLESIEPLRQHPSLRIVSLAMAREPDLTVLASMESLVAVRRGKNFTSAVPWPDVAELPVDHPLRAEWTLAMRE
jgi:Leucine-rich repeat (LRR) protein